MRAAHVTMAARAMHRATCPEPIGTTRRQPPARHAGSAHSSHVARHAHISSRRQHRRFAAAATDGGGTEDDPWNKGPIDLDARLYGYLLRHTREPDVLRELRVETAQLRGSQMQVPPEQGAFMRLLVELTNADERSPAHAALTHETQHAIEEMRERRYQMGCGEFNPDEGFDDFRLVIKN